MGYLLKWSEGGGKIDLEADTISCSHCQKVMTMKHWKEEGPWCYKCGHGICLQCLERSRVNGCVPFMQQVERQLSRRRLLEVMP